MNQAKASKKRRFSDVTVFTALCAAAYFTSYITRYNYSAAMAEIIKSLDITKEAAGTAATGLFVAYGLGQIISGWLGDKFKPEKVLFSGLLTASVVNFGMALVSNIHFMTVLWCINGLAQAMLWPPLVKIMAGVLTHEQYDHACVTVTVAASCGSIGVYLLVPICIELSGWQASFAIPAVISMIVALVWIIAEPRMVRKLECAKKSKTDFNESGQKKTENRVPLFRIVMLAGLIPIMVAIILQGMLRDGITTWMPTFITDVYGLDTSVSILTTVVLPVFAIISITLSSKFQKLIGSELKASFWMFLLAAVSGVGAAFMIGIGSKSGASFSTVLTIIFMTLIAGCMHGVNLMLIGKLPAYFTKYGRVSTVSGILNTFTYVGSAISGYGFAVLSEKMGWSFTVGSWVVVSVLGMVACLISMPKWNKFSEK